jgi:uncharacterized protein (TIGR02246 family)
MTDLEVRLRRVEDQLAIRQLVAEYGFAVDAHDIDRLASLFTPDAVWDMTNGSMRMEGRDEVIGRYGAVIQTYGPSNHIAHHQAIYLDDADPDRATGLVNGHAEVWVDDRPMLAALLYDDVYRRFEGSWRFAQRTMSFLYYLDAREYGELLGDPYRVRAYGPPRLADLPEVLMREHRDA